ncbi:GNAT family N-acetyltransferase [Candidatus Woesearchaeota archaeon]|nr:GNAT family N-acetyltransferase [Candidatus Woesearchaeota archaeon]MCF7900840.1 GNAT family N-acetyltransferase [Candidatus Woesearchaeota archaeon]MCF8013838.1 GNAT family N-acetyltransferase [Candidatus Woesearchaeota archaeon]
MGFHKIEHRHKANFGYWLAEPYWGKGIMSEAVKQALTEFNKKFDIKRIEAGVFSWNKASMKVLEKNGFKLEGILKKAIKKENKYIDEHMYAKIK